MKGLIWFRHDLRIADNPALLTLSRRCSQAVMLFIINPDWFKATHFQSRHMGVHREAFLYQSLRELDLDLKKYNQRLIIKVGCPKTIIPALCKKHGIDLVATNNHPGVNEQQQTAYLKRVLPSEVVVCESFSLFLQHQLNFTKERFPTTFSAFRQRVSAHNLLPCIPTSVPESLPSTLKEKNDEWKGEDTFHPLPFYQGGEDAAQMQLKQFFWKTAGLQHYQQRRNALEGSHLSSRLSAWLANGCISVRSVAAELDKYEYRHGKDGSSQALYDELLLREYFQWMIHFFGHQLFSFEGIRKQSPTTAFYAERFKSWQQGNTAFPIVNACMHQLNQTGYLSNLGRQIVASCLVNELNIDWRFGAAYFEQQLIDFDVAINYGNWQNLAGVGVDPRATCHFNLEKQTQEFDPERKYIERWVNTSNKVI